MVKIYLLFIFGYALCFSTPLMADELGIDPTKPKTFITNKTNVPAIKHKTKQLLSAIFLKKGKKQAVINDQLLQVGDRFRSQKIIKITQSYVLLRNNKGVSKLTLTNQIKKTKKH